MEDIKEKTADEMFEELNYEKREFKNLIIYYYCEDVSWIKFNLDNKEIKSDTYITMKELQAINKKCKELGWI